MSFIQPIADDQATGPTAEMYAGAQADIGTVLNLHRAFAHLPEFMDHFDAMTGLLKAKMGVRRYELVTIAAALELKSSYCALAHAGKLMADGVDTDEMRRIADDRDEADLSDAERAMMAFAEEIVRDASEVSEARVDALRALGFSDAEISEIAAAAALRCFFSKYLDALGARPDARFGSVPEALLSALARGRAVEGGGPKT